MGAEREHATHEEAAVEAVPELGGLQPAVGPERVLALQRTAGNASVTQLLTQGERRVSRGSDKKPSNDLKLEFEVPLGKGGRYGSLRFALKTKGAAMAEASTGPGDVTATGRAGGSEAKLAYKWGEGFAATLTSRLATAEIGTSPFEWLTVKVKVDALKTKLDLRDPKASVSALEVAVELEAPTLPEELLSALSEELGGKVEGASFVGEYRYAVSVDDLWNLYKWASASEDMATWVEDVGRKSEQLDALKARRDEIRRKLATEFDESRRPHGRSPKGKAARRQWNSRLKALQAEAAELDGRVAGLADEVTESRRLLGKAGRALQTAERKIKGAAGRVVVKAFGEAGLAALKEIGEKFVPIANVVATANDLYELGEKVANVGDLQIGLDGGDEPGASGDAGAEGGTEEAGSTEPGDGGGDTAEGGEPGETGEGELERPEGLSANGREVFEAVVPRTSRPGVEWQPEDWRAIDGLVADLSPEQLAAVLDGIEEMKAGGGIDLETMDQLFGTILMIVEGVRTSRVKPEDTSEAQRKNEIEQRVIGFDPQQVTGRSMDAGSREFAQWTRAYQEKNGLEADGVFGPSTASHWYQENKLADSPAAKRAKAELRRRARGKQAAAGGERSKDADLIDDPLHYLVADGDRLVRSDDAVEKAKNKRVKLSTGLEVEIQDVEVTDADEPDQKVVLVTLSFKITAIAKDDDKLKVGEVRGRRWTVVYDAPDGPKEILEVLGGRKPVD